MIDNVDVFIDKIIEIHDYDYSIIYEFEDFYKYNSKRLIPMDIFTLLKAVKLYCEDDKKCFHIYGFSSFWDVSNIKNMSFIFMMSGFNGDISKWNVSNVENMAGMFHQSCFNGDISKWNVSNVENMEGMFHQSCFNGNISKWNVSNVENMDGMFYHCHRFNGDISKWNVSNVENMSYVSSKLF